MADIREFAERFVAWEQKGDHYIACCPLCDKDGKSKHLEISPAKSKDGTDTALLHCHHSPHEVSDILAAVGLQMKDLYFNSDQHHERREYRETVSRREHQYNDENGAILGKKVISKYSDGGKGCCWYRREENQWVPGLKDKQMPLYHIDKLLRSKDILIYIAEGEKDVETLESMGLTATTSPNGAGATKWRDADGKYFKGKFVVVLSDNDDVGRQMGEATANAILNYAEAVTWLETSTIWPDAPDKSDISDVVAKFGKDTAFSMLNDAQSKVDQWMGSDRKIRKAKSAADFGEDNTKFEWYPYLPIGDYSVMMADGGTGKTILCCGIAAAISTGRNLPGEVFGRSPERVLIISAEDRGEMLKKRLTASGANLSNVFILDCMDSEGMNFTDGYVEFMNTVLTIRPSLVIIDPWHAFLGSDIDINRVNAVRPVFQRLANMAKKCECAMVLVSHVNKRAQGENANNAATGSTDFVNAARSAVRVIFDETDDDARIMVHTKTNYAAYGQSVKYKIDDGGVVWDGFSEITRATLEEAARKRSTPFEVKQDNENRDVVNTALIEAIKKAASPFVPTSFSYDEFKKKYGDLIFGGQQPKRAIDSVRDELLDNGVAVRTGIHVKRNGKPLNGFSAQILSPQSDGEQQNLLS